MNEKKRHDTNHKEISKSIFRLSREDIKSKKEIAGIQVTQGPKAQVRQAIGVGLQYVF